MRVEQLCNPQQGELISPIFCVATTYLVCKKRRVFLTLIFCY
jgi:hypothetical protein